MLACLSFVVFLASLALAVWLFVDAILWDRDLRGSKLLMSLALGGVLSLCAGLILVLAGTKSKPPA